MVFKWRRDASPDGTTTDFRDSFPSDYLVKINSFSVFAKQSKVKYETDEFEAGGYKWRLTICPGGVKRGYLSMSLASSDNKVLKLNGSEVHATVNFSIYNNKSDNYLVKQGIGRRFNVMKPNWGITELIKKKTLKKPSNGYIANDTCTFGVGILIYTNKAACAGESLNLQKGLAVQSGFYHWNISDFSQLQFGVNYTSKTFLVSGHKWRIELKKRGQYISMFLYLVEASSCQQVNATFNLRFRPSYDWGVAASASSHWFKSTRPSCGWTGFAQLYGYEQYYLLKNCVITAYITVIGTAKKMS